MIKVLIGLWVAFVFTVAFGMIASTAYVVTTTVMDPTSVGRYVGSVVKGFNSQ